MARKKRRFEQLEAAASTPTAKKTYNDPFQQQVNQRLEDAGKRFEGKGKTILYGIAAAAVLAIIVLLFMNWSKKSEAAAQAALGKAIEVSRYRVTDTPPAAGSTEKTFKTEKERAEAAIAEFQTVVDKFGGSVGDKAKYFIAVNRLNIDREAGIKELETLASSSSPEGKLAKFAVAQQRVNENKLDEALKLFTDLKGLDNALISKETIDLEIAKIHEKHGKKQEAADIYFNIAKAASEAKDLDGKPIRLTDSATTAKEKLTELDPERAKQIVEPTPESPFGAGGVPMGIQ